MVSRRSPLMQNNARLTPALPASVLPNKYGILHQTERWMVRFTLPVSPLNQTPAKVSDLWSGQNRVYHTSIPLGAREREKHPARSVRGHCPCRGAAIFALDTKSEIAGAPSYDPGHAQWATIDSASSLSLSSFLIRILSPPLWIGIDRPGL